MLSPIDRRKMCVRERSERRECRSHPQEFALSSVAVGSRNGDTLGAQGNLEGKIKGGAEEPRQTLLSDGSD